jgi:nucleoside 2-deoxyribosyltransferase
VINTPVGHDVRGFDCPVCGQYFIARTAYVGLKELEDPLLPFLSCHTRQVWESDGHPFTVDSNWKHYAELHARTTLGQMLEKLLRVAEKRTPAPGALFQFDHLSEFPLLDCARPDTALFLLNHAVDLKLIESGHGTKPLWRIKFAGWEHIERTGLSSQSSARVFVAMSFKSALNQAFDEGIKPAIETDCGLSCYRIDRDEHNEKICDRILAEIRRCQIVVADFTNNAQGVYFEAGFALALGKTVIWSVRSNHIRRVHFDTRQYNHIVWKDPKDLRTRLRDRIQALFPEALNRAQSQSR